MSDLTYEKFAASMKHDDAYHLFVLDPRRLRSFRLHLGEEALSDERGNPHAFDLIWFKDTEELVAVEIESSLGTILPFNFRLRRSTDRFLFLGNFTERGIDDLLVFQGGIIDHLWALHTQE